MMDISSAEEDYLKNILRLSGRDRSLVSTGLLSSAMDLTAGTITAMIKNLERKGFLEYQARKGCRLTEKGQARAVSVLRKHRLVETLLVNLGMEKRDVHQEAEILEHAISRSVEALLDSFLSYPRIDPHGNPIPMEGEVAAMPVPFLESKKDTSLQVVSLGDLPRETIAYFEAIGLKEDSMVKLVELNKAAGVARLETQEGLFPVAISLLNGIVVLSV